MGADTGGPIVLRAGDRTFVLPGPSRQACMALLRYREHLEAVDADGALTPDQVTLRQAVLLGVLLYSLLRLDYPDLSRGEAEAIILYHTEAATVALSAWADRVAAWTAGGGTNRG